MKKILQYLTGLCLVLWCRVALAVPSPSPSGYLFDDYRDPALDQGAPLWQTILGMGFKLILVLGILAACYWFLQRYLARQSLLGVSTGSRMRVLESMPLVGSQTIHLVAVKDRVLMLASNGQGMVEKLAEFAEEEVSFQELMDLAENPQPIEASLRRIVIPEGDA